MFDMYKPFRNRLRQYSIADSLKTVFHFMQWLDFDVPLPAHLSPPPLWGSRNRMLSGLVQWEFEVLAREIVLNGDNYGRRSIASWNDVSREINAIKAIENECWKGRQDGDVLYELVRIAHRQFPWQRGICPIPTFLLRRATSEIYFDLVKDQARFAKSFGPAVQQLVGEIAERSNRSGRLTVISEVRYGPPKAPKDM